MVADFTCGADGARGGVYYEAGFAQDLNLDVIFTCRENCIKDVHFDTSHFNHPIWKDPADLRDRLQARIEAILDPRRPAPRQDTHRPPATREIDI